MVHWQFIVFAMFLLFNYSNSKDSLSNDDDDEFAEFEDPDDISGSLHNLNNEQNKRASKVKEQKTSQVPESESKSNAEQQKPQGNLKMAPNAQQDDLKTDDEDSTLETEDDEFRQSNDAEEFEGIEKDKVSSKKDGRPDLKIADVPHHLTASWESYYLEIMMFTGLVVYLLNFLVGKTKNARLANHWFSTHKDLLESNFSIVGDDGQATPTGGILMKDSEHIYSLWCSGRVCCEGMLVELKFLKRQDLVSVISKYLKPGNDNITVTVNLGEEDMDNFVMAIGNKKRISALIKEYPDLATFCPDKKAAKPGLPESFALLSEIGEATAAVLDATVCKILRDFDDNVEYIHISDQYTGPKVQQEENQNTKLPEVQRVMICSFKVGRKGVTNTADMESMKPLFKFVFFMIDKLKRIKLSKEAKIKSDKNRLKAMESYQKQVHSQRQEAAQVRREEKRRQEKEKLMNEEDPDRARKLEHLDSKREQKRKQPKIKMLKVKGM